MLRMKERAKDVDFMELIKGSSTAFALKTFSFILSYLSTLVMARYFGAEVIGVYSIAIAVLSIMVLISKLGFDCSLIKFVALYSSTNRFDLVRASYRKALVIVALNGLLVSVLFFLFSSNIAEFFFGKEYLSHPFKVIALAILPMTIIAIDSGAFRGLKKIRDSFFYQDVSVRLFALIVLILLIVTQFDFDQSLFPLAAFVGGAVLTVVLSQISWFRNSRKFPGGLGSPKLPTEKLKYSRLLKVSLPMMFSTSMLLLMQWTDTLLLGYFSTDEQVGIYNVALRMSLVTSIFLVAINSIAAPKFAEMYAKGNIAALGKLVRQSTKLIFWSSVPIIMIISIFPSFVLGLFGNEFKTGVYALVILMLGQFFSAISGSVGFLLQMTGKQNAFLVILVFAIVFNIFLNITLIPIYGIMGSAIANTFSTVFWNLASVIYIKMQFRFTTIYLPVITR